MEGIQQHESIATELVFGLIGPIGCDRETVISELQALAPHYSYEVKKIKVSDLIQKHALQKIPQRNQFKRVMKLMDLGNHIRKSRQDNSIMAKLAAIEIAKQRPTLRSSRIIWLIDSLKHPEEVRLLKDVYGNGFFLFAIHSGEKYRDKFLKNYCHVKSKEDRGTLIARDRGEELGWGQRTSSAFHLADFFLAAEDNSDRVWNALERFLDAIFGDPFCTPTFQEFAMFMAHASSTRSSDLSRQVGAVIARNKEVIASGANESPQAFGGTYWPSFDPSTFKITDDEYGRDYKRGQDFNGAEKRRIMDALKEGIPQEAISTLEDNIVNAGIKDITEFGRVVHAEMDALLSCARRGENTKDAVMFCTTFPCHNCAKHIVASGIRRVIYIEPYPKSKALEMHDDSITTSEDEEGVKVLFRPFIGVGPRQYINLFSMHLGFGAEQTRKYDGYQKALWSRGKAVPRVKMFNTAYGDIEKGLSQEVGKLEELPKLTDFSV